MRKLTGNQAYALYRIVRYAQQFGGRVPTDKELGSILGVSATMGNHYRTVINSKLNCFEKDGRRSWKVKDDALCTQPESAAYFLIFYRMSQLGRVSLSAFHDILHKAFPDRHKSEGLQTLLRRGLENGYLKQVTANPDSLEVGHRLYEELDYLELLLIPLIEEEIFSRVSSHIVTSPASETPISPRS